MTAQQGYGTAAIGAQARTSTLAIISLVAGIGQLVLGPAASITAIVCGHIARRDIRRTGENGDGLALAGLILGYIGLALMVLVIIAGIALLAAGSVSSVHSQVGQIAPVPGQP